MPKHHTTDPGQRAADIAEHEADKAYRSDGPLRYFPTWSKVHDAALKELAGCETTANETNKTG